MPSFHADAIISPFGTGFVFTAATARISYGLSQIGFLPDALKKLTHRGVPLRSMMFNYCVGLLLFLPFPSWQKLASFIISCFVISYVIGPLSLVGLRKQQPDKHRPFLLPYATSISLVAFYICNLLIFWTGWHTISRMMIALCVGFLFFTVHCYYERENKRIQQWRTAWWIFPYFSALALASYLGTFDGGKKIIPFGMDFGVIALITVVIFYCALKSVKKTQ
jgi:amino acid transporter